MLHDRFSGLEMTRRRFLGATAAAAGALAAPALWTSSAFAAHPIATVLPLPIPGGVTPPIVPPLVPVHHFPPVPVLGPALINEPSQITDFNGLVGVTRVTGSGTGTDKATGVRSPLTFQVDNGFMSGLYVGEDGRHHHGTFAFV